MWRIIVNRLAFGVAIVLLITIVVFGLSRAAGDPRNIYLDEYATPEAWDAWGERMGLDKPLYVQYGVWLWDVLQGDFGESLYYNIPSIRLVGERVPNTVQLGGVAFGVAILIGIPMGVISAVRRGTIVDYAVRGFALLGQSVPVFWIALMMILVFSLQLGWLPSSRNEGWNHFIMPAIALGWLPAAGLMRITRGAMLNILDSEYIKLARAKGVNSGSIVWVHGFRNAIIPPLTVAALIFAAFLTRHRRHRNRLRVARRRKARSPIDQEQRLPGAQRHRHSVLVVLHNSQSGGRPAVRRVRPAHTTRLSH